MKYIIDYNKYNTGNPYEDPYLYEGKGVPHILKWLVNKITDDIDINNKYNIDIDESDLKLKNLTIICNGEKRPDIYGIISNFGSPIKSDSLCLDSPILNLRFDFNNYNPLYFKKTILHELLHLYEVYNRIKSNTKKDLDWFVNNTLYKIRNKYDNNIFIRDFIYTLYLSYKQEMGARISETYILLINERSDDIDHLKSVLIDTAAWKHMEYIKNFDYNKYNINYDKCLEFFTELNQNIKPKLINKFNMFEIPKNNTDINNILKEYKKLFYKKSIYFENKLIKVIDEVVKDVKNINETWKKQLKQL